MKLLIPFLERLPTISLLLIIAIGLINTEYFYSPTTIAYYGFCIATLLFVIIPYNIHKSNNKTITLKMPHLLFGLWCLYVLIHYFTNTGTLVFTIYSIVLYLLLLKATALFSTPDFNFKLLFVSIAGIASLESIYCIIQFLGWLKSQNELFTVTGSWNNPNITAVFLALTLPVFLYLFRSKYKKIIKIGLITLLIALLLLKCRGALIGTVLSIIIFYGLEYDFISWIKNKKNRTSVKALFILGLLIIIPVSSHLYDTKKASAEGRKFIWKLSTQMATEKPLIGYGYGYFEKEYNLYQANYIKNGKATAEELVNAGPVIMPHNELLQNAVEGGSIGLVMILLFFCSLLLTVKQQKKSVKNVLNTGANDEVVSQEKKSVFNLSYAGVVAFIGMSMVNSTIQNVPIMALLTIYAAIICSTINHIRIPLYFTFHKNNNLFSLLFKTTIIIISIYLLFILFEIAIADRKNKNALSLKKEYRFEHALQIMQSLENNLGVNNHYWENYGNIYFKIHKYKEALDCLKKAKKWSSHPNLYLGSGACYKELNMYPEAIIEYETLIALYPSKFLYRMLLLDIYIKNKDITNAITLAQQIIKLKPKIPSDKIHRYKNICLTFLKQFATPKMNRSNNNSMSMTKSIKKDNIKFNLSNFK